MCEPNAYLTRGGREEIVMENVGHLSLEGDQVVLETMLGDRREVRGVIREIDFLQNRIVIDAR
jgi:predicted RNA-binding protein